MVGWTGGRVDGGVVVIVFAAVLVIFSLPGIFLSLSTGIDASPNCQRRDFLEYSAIFAATLYVTVSICRSVDLSVGRSVSWSDWDMEICSSGW